jgi:Asp-tRNA(Asn)/Glu-tRNA(Gln) amidotransferase A subunit family amidase
VSSTALELAAVVRAGDRSAADVVEEHLAVVAAREPELHACNLVTDEAARAAAATIDALVQSGEDPGPLAGVPIVLKDNLCTPAVHRNRRRAGRRRRRDPDRQDQPRRVRDGFVHRELGVRTHSQPA